MNEELFKNLSLSAQEQYLIQEEILQGKYGAPGDAFMTTRALAESRQVSIVTAHNVLTGLCSAGYLELRGKKYFLSHSELMESRNNLTNIIGMLVPHLNNEFYSSLSDAVIDIAQQRGYSVLILTTSYSSTEEKKAMQLLLQLGAAGIINCIPTHQENVPLYKNCPVPCIFLGHSLEGCKRTSVQVNAFPISQKVARHLMEQGYQRFMYIGTQNLPLEEDIRFTAFQMELKQNGFSLSHADTIQISPGSSSDDGLLRHMIEKQGGPIGIFCYHDLIAAKVYRICTALGKRIPNDVGIVGFDDLSIASTLTPALTTIQYRVTSMADMTVKLLLTAIKSPNAPYDNFYVDPNLIVRESSMLSGHK